MDELLPYYNRELAYLRKLGAEFAEKHPKIAARLRMSGEQVEDPHVSRLIESVAFLTARVRRKIDDDFPEIAESMLSVLYPHLLQPFPSVCVAGFALGKASWASDEPRRIERGASVETEPIDGEPCRFRTCYDTELWPIRVAEAELRSMPARSPLTEHTSRSAAVCRVVLETLSPKVKFSDLGIGSLRFFLNGQTLHTTGLHERLLSNCLGVALASEDYEKTVTLPDGAVTPCGFDEDQGLIDYDARSFLGYRLISEYYVLPEKFLFIDVELGAATMARVGDGRRVELTFFLDAAGDDLERNVDASTFQLGCTPLANLFSVRAEPIRLSGEVAEYRITPDARRPLSHEVVAIDGVSASRSDDEKAKLLPLYSVEHGVADEQRLFWHSQRRAATVAEHRVDHGSEVYITPIDLDAEPLSLDGWTLDVGVLCCNRDLPARLPFGGGEPRLRLGAGGATEVTCLTPPTRTLRPTLGPGAVWRLVSKLSLNHASLVDNAATLREILNLYDFVETQQSRTLVEAVKGVSSRRVVGRVGRYGAHFCRGVEVTLELDEDLFSGGGQYLFASVLERFLALYTTVNSFTKTRVVTNRQEGTVYQWPPRAGDRVLV